VKPLLVCIIALALAACQTGRVGGGLDGNWASDDGVFVATFDNGAFISRLTGTGETVVADGRYSRSAGGIQLEWTSIAANERRSAQCEFLGSGRLRCAPSVGEPFTMTRVV
jgi:hypothetical protein